MVDVCDVVAAVPSIDEGSEFNRLRAVFGVAEAALPLGVIEGLEEHDPAGVEGFDELERPLDRGGGVMKGSPGFFVVGFDGGPIFGEGETNADEGVHVAVGDMVDELADGPASIAIGAVELLVVEALDSVAKLAGQVRNIGDGAYTEIRGDGVGLSEFADGVAGIMVEIRHEQGRWRALSFRL
jgi:hypothetical protein